MDISDCALSVICGLALYFKIKIPSKQKAQLLGPGNKLQKYRVGQWDLGETGVKQAKGWLRTKLIFSTGILCLSRM